MDGKLGPGEQPKKEELRRECTGRTCKGTMIGERLTYVVGKVRVNQVKWTCQKWGKVEI